MSSSRDDIRPTAGYQLDRLAADAGELAPYYDKAELRMGVTASHGIPRSRDERL